MTTSTPTAPTEPTAPARRPVTVRVARWSATHPWRAIALWLAFVLACLAIGQLCSLRQMSDADGTVGQSHRATALMQRADLQPPDTENVLISARSGPFDTAAARRAAAAVSAAMHRLPEVAAVAAPVTSKDGADLLVSARM